MADYCLHDRWVPGHHHPRWASPQARWESAKDNRRLTVEPVMSSVPVLSGGRWENKTMQRKQDGLLPIGESLMRPMLC